MDIDFKKVFTLLRQLFDSKTPAYEDFVQWRHQTYRQLKQKEIANLPLKTWWPKYTDGDFRLELSIGALLIQQVSWPAVRTCIENIQGFLKEQKLQFNVEGVLRIPPADLEILIKPSRFPGPKSRGIHKFCAFLQEAATIDEAFQGKERSKLGKQLAKLKCGFGPETRDCVLLYTANLPAFIADAYACKLLKLLSGKDCNYHECQKTFEQGINRDFSADDLAAIGNDYTPQELDYALCNSPQQDVEIVLLYQQFHAAIDELGISKRWDEFAQKFDNF